MELGEMNNIRHRCMKAHFKDDGMHNDLEEFANGKNPQRVKSNVISRQCNHEGWPGFPGSSVCLLTEMWGFTPCIEANRKTCPCSTLDIRSDILGSSSVCLIFHQLVSNSSNVAR